MCIFKRNNLILIEEIPMCLNSKAKKNFFKVTAKTQLLSCFDGNFKIFCFTFVITLNSVPSNSDRTVYANSTTVQFNQDYMYR
jgi:hypothetical protein